MNRFLRVFSETDTGSGRKAVFLPAARKRKENIHQRTIGAASNRGHKQFLQTALCVFLCLTVIIFPAAAETEKPAGEGYLSGTLRLQDAVVTVNGLEFPLDMEANLAFAEISDAVLTQFSLTSQGETLLPFLAKITDENIYAAFDGMQSQAMLPIDEFLKTKFPVATFDGNLRLFVENYVKLMLLSLTQEGVDNSNELTRALDERLINTKGEDTTYTYEGRSYPVEVYTGEYTSADMVEILADFYNEGTNALVNALFAAFENAPSIFLRDTSNAALDAPARLSEIMPQISFSATRYVGTQDDFAATETEIVFDDASYASLGVQPAQTIYVRDGENLYTQSTIKTDDGSTISIVESETHGEHGVAMRQDMQLSMPWSQFYSTDGVVNLQDANMHVSTTSDPAETASPEMIGGSDGPTQIWVANPAITLSFHAEKTVGNWDEQGARPITLFAQYQFSDATGFFGGENSGAFTVTGTETSGENAHALNADIKITYADEDAAYALGVNLHYTLLSEHGIPVSAPQGEVVNIVSDGEEAVQSLGEAFQTVLLRDGAKLSQNPAITGLVELFSQPLSVEKVVEITGPQDNAQTEAQGQAEPQDDLSACEDYESCMPATETFSSIDEVEAFVGFALPAADQLSRFSLTDASATAYGDVYLTYAATLDNGEEAVLDVTFYQYGSGAKVYALNDDGTISAVTDIIITVYGDEQTGWEAYWDEGSMGVSIFFPDGVTLAEIGAVITAMGNAR